MVVISMLRGVNLGPHRRVRMEPLRATYESIGYIEPQTCLQSGNVIFKTKERDLAKIAAKIEKAVERDCGFHSDVILRTAADLRNVLATNPFARRTDVIPGQLLVTFLAASPAAEAPARVRAIKADPEELHLHGRELFVYYPNGAGRSKLTMAVMEKAVGVTGTARNWNTVGKLLEMATALEEA